MRAYGVKALAIALAFILFIQPVAALTEMSVPFVTTDSIVFVQPLEFADLTITEFNQTNYCREPYTQILIFPEALHWQAADRRPIMMRCRQAS